MSTTKDLDRLLQHYVDERGVPGAAYSVYRGEDKLYEGYFGYRDMAKTQPLTPDTIFRIHSITKAFSALCGMMQFERGAFLMDDPVYEYIPEYRHMKLSVKQPDGTWTVEDAKEPMLMKHVFNMNVGFYAHDDSPTAKGLPECHEKLGGSKFQSDYTLETEIRALAEVPMLFEPGSHWQYGYGIDIMAVVVELTSGKSLGQYMKENIFDPLDMKDTDFRFRPGWRERLAECVEHLPDGSVVHCDHLLVDPLDTMYRETALYEGADVGLLSTLSDLQTFSAMLACGGIWKGERIIGRKTIDLMRTNLLDEEMMKEFHTSMPEMQGYGYGYGVRTYMDQAAGLCTGSVGEFGWLGAAGAWMMADPEEKLSAALMLQDMLPDSKYYNNHLRAVTYGLL
ncbi:MAG: beta-lactamase family protein [Lachnospiraceae bacterium]|nr:beta-lactamase family protein [Lachnospiraceae bacterium]